MKVTGVNKLLKQFDQFGKEGAKVAAGEVEAAAKNMVKIAKKNAPGNFGKLKQGIQPEKINKLFWEVKATAPYSGYVEFGTGPRVFVPSEMKEIANALKGTSTGDFDDFMKSIEDWCIAKGIKPNMLDPDQYDFQNMYFLIAQSILHKGLRPQPYIYPALVQSRAIFTKSITNAFNELTKKLNNAR